VREASSQLGAFTSVEDFRPTTPGQALGKIAAVVPMTGHSTYTLALVDPTNHVVWGVKEPASSAPSATVAAGVYGSYAFAGDGGSSLAANLDTPVWGSCSSRITGTGASAC